MIREFYGLSEDFQTDHLLVRSENEKNKILYLVSASVKQVLLAADVHKLRVISTLMTFAYSTFKQHYLTIFL
jgi:hypothetical protein